MFKKKIATGLSVWAVGTAGAVIWALKNGSEIVKEDKYKWANEPGKMAADKLDDSMEIF